jgi:hypothetical protein
LIFLIFGVLMPLSTIFQYNSYKPITNTAWVRARLCKLQKGCTRLVAARDNVYQLLAHGRWFSPASFTTKTGRHDIAEILLKVALKHQKSKKSNLNYTSESLSGIIKKYTDFYRIRSN